MCKFITSKVIGKNPPAWWNTHPPVLTRRSRVKISANQSTLLSVLFFNLLFWRWLEAIHHAFHYVNLSNMCGRQAFLFINLSNVSFFIVIQSVRILMSFWQKPITSTVSKLFRLLEITQTHTPLRASIEIAWIGLRSCIDKKTLHDNPQVPSLDWSRKRL